MKTIKVLIADDSVVYRSQIRAALQELGKSEIVGTASNGKVVLEYLAHSQVDLLILDLEMPEMDGIETLKEIQRKKFQCKTLVFSSASKRGAEAAMDALRLGAADFVTKVGAGDAEPGKPVSEPREGHSHNPNRGPILPSQRIKDLLMPKIQGLFKEVNFGEASPQLANGVRFSSFNWNSFKPRIVVIGSSTGGPTVLEKIFSELSSPLECPIVIVQHMPPVFTATLAERISRMSGIRAVEASDGMKLEGNSIYVAPGDYHLRLEGSPERTKLVLDQGPQIHSVRPAVDPLFTSAAAIFKELCLGVVLTGMGMDGKQGAIKIKENGGAVVIQDEASCVVFGMPGAVFSAGAFDRQANPAEIVTLLKDKVARGRSGGK